MSPLKFLILLMTVSGLFLLASSAFTQGTEATGDEKPEGEEANVKKGKEPTHYP